MSDNKVVDLISQSYAEQLDGLWAAVAAAKADEDKGAGPPRMMSEEPDSVRLAQQYAAVKAEAEADARENRRHVELYLTRKAWRELKEKHPPRVGEDVPAEDAEADRRAGMNVDTGSDDLVFASIVEPKFTSRADFDDWADGLTNGQFTTLVLAAWEHAHSAHTNPKDLPASLTQSSASS